MPWKCAHLTYACEDEGTWVWILDVDVVVDVDTRDTCSALTPRSDASCYHSYVMIWLTLNIA